MKVISFVTQKGGSGKTTLCINSAVAAIAGKRRAVVLDLDPQGTAEDWYQQRSSDAPQIIRLGHGELAEALALAENQKFDFALIDTPGRDEPAQAAAIRASDFCVIPCRPTFADIKAVASTVATVRRLEKPFAFVMTQTQPHTSRIREGELALSAWGDVCPFPIVTRNAYQDSQTRGEGVIEYDPRGRAAEETENVWRWILKKLKT